MAIKVCSGVVWSICKEKQGVYIKRRSSIYCPYAKSAGGVVNTNAIDGLIDLSLESVIDAPRKPL